MRPAPREVPSFGRRPEQSDVPVILPPVQMPSVQLPVVLVVDATSLRDASAAITQMVAEAVRAGFAEAMADHDPEAAAELARRDVRLDPDVGAASAQAAEL